MQSKLPDTIIWLPQKITLNYGIVPARAMKSSRDSVRIPYQYIMRTADQSSREIQLIFRM